MTRCVYLYYWQGVACSSILALPSGAPAQVAVAAELARVDVECVVCDVVAPEGAVAVALKGWAR